MRFLTKATRTDEDTDAAERLQIALDRLDLDQVINLVRAFSAYFHLANVAEQTHRLGDLAVGDHGRTFAATVDRIIGSAPEPDVVAAVVERLELRPVFTAHPTEAVRRTLFRTAHLGIAHMGGWTSSGFLEGRDSLRPGAVHRMQDRS